MQDIQEELECQQANHDQAKIYFFCLNKECKFSRKGCHYCAEEIHKSHLQDCFMIKFIQQLLDNEKSKLKKFNERVNELYQEINKLGKKIIDQIDQYINLLKENDLSKVEDIINLTLNIYDKSIIENRKSIFKIAVGQCEQQLWIEFDNIYSQDSKQFQIELCKNQSVFLLKHNKYEEAKVKLNEAQKISPNDFAQRSLDLIQNFKEHDWNIVSPVEMLQQMIQKQHLFNKTRFSWVNEQKSTNFIHRIINIMQHKTVKEINEALKLSIIFYQESSQYDDQDIQINLEFTFLLALYSQQDQGIKFYEKKLQQSSNCHLINLCKTILLVTKNPEQKTAILQSNKESLNQFMISICPKENGYEQHYLQNLIQDFIKILTERIYKLRKNPLVDLYFSIYLKNQFSEVDCYDLKQQINIEQQDFYISYLLCINLLEQFKFNDLKQQSNIAIKLFPHKTAFYFFQAYCLILEEQYEGVLDVIDLEQQKTKQKDLQFLKGFILYKKKKYEESLKLFEQLQDQYNFEYYQQMQGLLLELNQIGILSFYLGQREQALEIFKNIYTRNPKNQQALYNQCVTLFHLNELEVAIECLNQVQNNQKSYLLKAYHNILQGNFKEAENQLKNLDMHHQKQGQCLYAISLSESNQFNQADQIINMIIQNNEYDKLFIKHGLNLINNGYLQEAKNFFGKMIENGMEQETSYLFLSYILLDLKQYDELKESLEELFRLNPRQQGGVIELQEYLQQENDDELVRQIQDKIKKELVKISQDCLQDGLISVLNFDDDFGEIMIHLIKFKWIRDLYTMCIQFGMLEEQK